MSWFGTPESRCFAKVNARRHMPSRNSASIGRSLKRDTHSTRASRSKNMISATTRVTVLSFGLSQRPLPLPIILRATKERFLTNRYLT